MFIEIEIYQDSRNRKEYKIQKNNNCIFAKPVTLVVGQDEQVHYMYTGGEMIEISLQDFNRYFRVSNRLEPVKI